MRQRFVGNLFSDTRSADLRQLFAPRGRLHPIRAAANAVVGPAR